MFGEEFQQARVWRASVKDHHSSHTLIDCIQRELGHLVRFIDHQAGMIVVVKLPPGSDDRTIAENANN